MTLKLDKVALFIYLSFAFDSAFKINTGIQLHLGILSILMTNGLVIMTRPTLFLTPLLKDYFFLFFTLYCTVNGLLFANSGFGGLLIYLMIACNVLIFCAYTIDLLDKKAFLYFQMVMIITGLGQYFAYQIFGYQLSFIDAEHYQKGSSVSHRLRGFFIEPNWFAIAFTFNTLLLIREQVEQFLKEKPWVAFFTVVVFILNGTLATVGALILIYSIPYLRKAPIKGIIILLILLSLLAAVFSFRDEINQKQAGSSALNHSSRVIPLLRVVEFQNKESFTKLFFGQGLGSWGTLAVDNRLSVLVFEPKVGVRDGSEVPVILFELGIFGCLLIVVDMFISFFKCPARLFHLRGGLLLFFICLALYPTFKFWMYMPYYFYMRAYIYGSKTV
jgi:hypothetical protein